MEQMLKEARFEVELDFLTHTVQMELVLTAEEHKAIHDFLTHTVQMEPIFQDKTYHLLKPF